jgi:hypothetical protein
MKRKRDYRLELLRALPKGGRCAEIGVWKGDFSQQILDEKEPVELNLVDPWIFRPDHPRRMYGGKIAKSQSDMDAIFREVEARFANVGSVIIHRAISAVYFSQLDAVLDWVYIDGDHSESAVFADLVGAWRAVKPGGIVSGDDVDWQDREGSFPIRRALERFACEAAVLPQIANDQFTIDKPMVG